MKPLRINFAPRSFQQRLLSFSWWGWLWLTLSAILLTTTLVQWWHLESQLQPIDQEIDAIREQWASRRPSQTTQRPLKVEPETVRAINAVVDQLNTPWQVLLDALESTATPKIAMLEISPDNKKRVLKGVAEAGSTDEMLAFIERMKQQPLFSRVTLTRHEMNEQDQNRPVRFEYEARWAGGQP